MLLFLKVIFIFFVLMMSVGKFYCEVIFKCVFYIYFFLVDFIFLFNLMWYCIFFFCFELWFIFVDVIFLIFFFIFKYIVFFVFVGKKLFRWINIIILFWILYLVDFGKDWEILFNIVRVCFFVLINSFVIGIF